ncbi:MAG: M28 family peptidase [Nitrospirota bacterium]|jgi:Zn-dependent M28 family amino/carboxypeptidase
MPQELQDRLARHVGALAEDIGVRSYLDLARLESAASYIEDRLREAGIEARRQEFSYRGETYFNVLGEVEGTGPSGEALLVGAHYDTVTGSPGADDNASAVAGMIELARLAAKSPLPLTAKFAAFTLEEPPAFRSSRMGSMVCAESLRKEGARLRGMISLEMIGYYTDEPGSQYYPLPGFGLKYPSRGNFIAFVGDMASKRFTREVRDAFRASSTLPVESLNTLSLVPGVDFSDHRSFWKHGYRAFMVTDTAFYRNPHYHAPSDLPRTLDYGRMAELVRGLYLALAELS